MHPGFIYEGPGMSAPHRFFWGLSEQPERLDSRLKAKNDSRVNMHPGKREDDNLLHFWSENIHIKIQQKIL